MNIILWSPIPKLNRQKLADFIDKSAETQILSICYEPLMSNPSRVAEVIVVIKSTRLIDLNILAMLPNFIWSLASKATTKENLLYTEELRN